MTHGTWLYPSLIVMALLLGSCGAPRPPTGASGSAQGEATTASTTQGENVARTPSPIDPALADSRWTLVLLNGAAPLPGSNITLDFEDGEVRGYAGCNWYGGPYTEAAEGSFVIREFSVTARECLLDGVMEQEAVFLQALQRTARYSVRDDRLELADASGKTTLVFSLRPRRAMNPDDLIGTRWTLQALNGDVLQPGSTITLAFTGEEISGSAGCRNYRGTYEAEGDEIHIGSMEMLELDCVRPRAYHEQEGRYTDSLTGATDYVLSDDRLEITNVEGVLVFGRLSPETSKAPMQTTWTLRAFVQGDLETPVLPSTTITLTFEGDTLEEQGRVAGSAGCNRYSATYTYINELEFSAPVSTRKACAEPAGIMEREQRYLDWLHDVTFYRLEDELRLETADGRALVFVAGPWE